MTWVGLKWGGLLDRTHRMVGRLGNRLLCACGVTIPTHMVRWGVPGPRCPHCPRCERGEG